jgi:hypothetical protein
MDLKSVQLAVSTDKNIFYQNSKITYDKNKGKFPQSDKSCS